MSGYQLYLHQDYAESSSHLPPLVISKAQWAQAQLGAYGRTPTVKSTVGLGLPWMRSPVQGSHFYLWWIGAGDAGFPSRNGPSILVHSIRHHDETDRPLDPGAPEDYAPLDLASVDPRFEEQTSLSESIDRQRAAFHIVQGDPGSGKTVALAYLARDLVTTPGIKKVRYITYSERLKNTARDLFRSWGPEVSSFITTHTVSDVVHDLLGRKDHPHTDEVRAFLRELEFVKPADLGPWRDFPHTLYTELRAYVFGRTFPRGYQLPKHREEQLRRSGEEIDAGRYARQRGFDLRTAEITLRLADRFRASYFLDQKLAADALDLLHKSTRCSTWLAHSDAFIVDEVQDLTLLQIALLGEMARQRRLHDAERPFTVTVSGDESQIVQPTGFKWSVTKDLLRDGLGEVNPREYVFQEQRRSPPLLSSLILGSWHLYDALPKQLKPKRERARAEQAVAPEADLDPGLVLVVPPPAGEDAGQAWRPLLEELSSRHGRALIDLTEQLAGQVAMDTGSEVLFSAREIKGLERSTILVHGLEALYQRIVKLAEGEGEVIPLLEVRRLIDQARVALSRSTSRIVLLEAADAGVFTALGLDPATQALRMELPELLEFLRSEDRTDIEMVYGLLLEADDLFERGRLAEAIRRNERAQAIAARTASGDLLHQVESQRAHLALEDAEQLLAAGSVPGAQAAFAVLASLRDRLDDNLFFERLEQLERRLAAASTSEFDRLSHQAERALQQGELEAAVTLAEHASELARQMELPALEERARLQVAEGRRRWAAALAAERDGALSPQIARLLRGLVDDGPGDAGANGGGAAQNELLVAAPAALLARRYELYPARRGLAHDQTHAVLGLARGVLRAPQPLEPEALAHVRIWLEELFDEIGERVSLFFEWATVALALCDHTDYPELDERFWDLENRLELLNAHDQSAESFRALLADYEGDPAGASLQWERLGDSERAIASARQAGDLERAYRLIQSNKSAQMPEALSTAVKAVRQLQQLGQKQHNLTPAERRALLEELARLHAILSAGDAPEA